MASFLLVVLMVAAAAGFLGELLAVAGWVVLGLVVLATIVGFAWRWSRSFLEGLKRLAGLGDRPRRSPMSLTRYLAAVTVVATVAAAACGDGDDEAATTTTTSSTTSTTRGDQRRALTQSCTQQDREVRIVVRYPEGWHANDGEEVVRCTAFDPEPIELRPGTEFPADLGVVLRVEPVGFDRASTAAGVRVEDERRVTIDGRRAVRQEAVTTGTGLGPAGRRSVRYVIDGGTDRSIIATTFDVEGNDFTVSVDVLDAMAATLEIDPRQA